MRHLPDFTALGLTRSTTLASTRQFGVTCLPIKAGPSLSLRFFDPPPSGGGVVAGSEVGLLAPIPLASTASERVRHRVYACSLPGDPHTLQRWLPTPSQYFISL